MASLNEVIHQPVRLQIMASLVALEPGTEVGFTYMADLLGLTDGNLGAHLRKLEEAGYVKIAKAFIDKKPHTYIAATDTGRQAFAEHVAALEAILQQGQNAKHMKER